MSAFYSGYASAAAEPVGVHAPAEDLTSSNLDREPVTDSRIREPAADGPYCGVYSLCACLNSVGVKPDLSNLVSLNFIGSYRGSSGNELVAAAESSGAFAKGFIGLTVDDLKSAKTPMILHVRGSWIDRTYNHWIAYLGPAGARARVFDPPQPLDTISFAELLANWDGLAIAVSNAPIDDSLVYKARVNQVAWALCVSALLLIGRFTIRPGEILCGSDSPNLKLRRIVARAGFVVVLGSVCGILNHATAETGFLANPDAVAEVTRRYHSANVPICSFDEIVERVKKKEGILIDARLSEDFNRGSIGNARNLPIDSTMAQREHMLRGIDRSSSIVIYCESSNCHYADEIATFLKFNGYTDLAIYRGGYREWICAFGHPTAPTPSDSKEVGK